MAKPLLEGVIKYLRAVCDAPRGGDLSDAEILGRFLDQREETAFALLVQRHGPMVRGVCRRVLGDRDSADDSFQATFVVLARSAGSIRSAGSLASWLYGVANRIARKARTQLEGRRRREKPFTDMPQPTGDVMWSELRSILDEEISRLPERNRVPIVLCYFEGKSYEQAAQELGWSKSTLAKRLTRARELLRRQLVRRGVSVSAAALAAGLCEQTTAAPLGALLTINTVRTALGALPGATGTACLISARVLTLAEGRPECLGPRARWRPCC
jgi:RNA polymerase sigma factor (sigma-70 family)